MCERTGRIRFRGRGGLRQAKIQYRQCFILRLKMWPAIIHIFCKKLKLVCQTFSYVVYHQIQTEEKVRNKEKSRNSVKEIRVG